MKREMDLVRDLLLAIERDGSPALARAPDIGGAAAETVVEHIHLLRQAGLVSAVDATTFDGRDYINIELTWAGHEFLDQVRDPEIWTKTKAGASKLGSWSIGLLGDIAMGYIKAKASSIGLPLG